MPRKIKQFTDRLFSRTKAPHSSPAKAAADPSPAVPEPPSVGPSDKGKPDDRPLPQDLWQSAYDRLDAKEQRVLSKVHAPTPQEDAGNGNSSTAAIIESVIQTTEEQYEKYQRSALKIHRSGGEDIDLRSLSHRIITAALSFKNVIDAVVALDPTQHAASAWMVVSLGLSMSKNRMDLRDALFDSSEYLADVLARHAYIEKNFYHKGGDKPEIGQAIVKVYTAVLRYTAEVLGAQNAGVGRWLRDSVTEIGDQRLTELKACVKEEGVNLHEWVQLDQLLHHGEQAESILARIDKMAESLQSLVKDFGLPIAEGAAYDSYMNQHEDICLPETRVELRSRISEWAESSDTPGVLEAIQKDSDISSKALSQQFDKLLLQPLLNLRLDTPTSTVVVIDALDECEQEEDIRVLLDLLPQLQKSPSLHLQILLTSRPELPIRLGFQQIEGHQDLELQELPNPVIERDIRLFLQDRLAKIQKEHSLPPGWPGEDITDILVSKSVPVFIFAATLCRFIGEKYQVPEDRLDAVLQDSASMSSSLMERIYLPLLNKLLKEAEASNFPKELHDALGVVILLANPLSVRALAQLVDIPERRIRPRLAAFHSVLRVPNDSNAPVRTLHSSFREFLLNTTSVFHVNETQSHQKIALYCVRVMDSSLKHNICGLSSYGTQRAEIDSQTIDKCLPAELQYACRHWVYHFEQTKDQVNEAEVLPFLKRHFLHWVEAMSLMGLTSEVVNMINTLRSITGSGLCHELSLFLQDAKLFVLKNIYICNDFPLQLYCSGLAFLPASSILKEVFQASQRWVNILTQGTSKAELQPLDDSSGLVQSVAFSPDGKMVVSGSKDNTIKLWDVESGQQRRTIEGHSDSVSSVAFSPDGQMIASGSYDNSIKLWDISGQQLRTLEGHSDSVVSVALSPDGHTLVSCSDDNTIKLWDTKTGVQLRTMKGHSDWIQSVAFSPDGQMVASASYDNTIKLWDVKVGEQLHTLEGHSSLVASVVFSPDGRIVTSGSYDNTAKLWDIKTGLQLYTLEGHSGMVRSVAFSPNGSMLASASYDNTIKFWDTKTGEQLRTLEGHSGPVRSVVFSPDGQIIASGSYDNTIRLWDTGNGQQVRTLGGQSGPVQPAASPPDSEVVDSSSPLSVQDGWVTCESEKVLWLPFDQSQFSQSATKGNTLTLGYPDGRVCTMEFTAPTM